MNNAALELPLLTAEGEAVTLSEFLNSESEYLLVVFLRHLACIPCVAHLREIAAHVDRLRDAGISVVMITQAEPKILAMFLRHDPQPFPIVADPSRQSYQAFGLERARWQDFFHPREIFRYLRLIAGGGRVKKPYAGEDLLQLGGDFLLDRDGNIHYAYRSRSATDWPTIEELLSAAKRG